MDEESAEIAAEYAAGITDSGLGWAKTIFDLVGPRADWKSGRLLRQALLTDSLDEEV